MRRLVPLSLLLLSACVMGPTRAQVLTRFIGADETTLVQAMGVPSRTYTTGGIKFLAYDERRTEVIPTPAAPFGWGWGYGYGWYSPFPPTVVQSACETTFEVVEGRVRSFNLRGNAC
jgi:hypothetical protein